MDFPFYHGGDQKSQLPELTLDAPRMGGDWEARGKVYEADEGLQHAVSVALLLGKPLLVTGEPGVGKTELANSIAYAFDRGEPIKLECKSTSVARDLFYSYDTLGRYLSAQTLAPTAQPATAPNPLVYLRYQALGEAMVRANPELFAGYLPEGYSKEKQSGPSVVLIDEVDKAPRDFPNDILNELENLYFRIPELGNVKLPTQPLPAESKPFVVITSNSEKNLPEAFLRRCIFYHIPFPADKMEKIAQNHFPALRGRSPFLTSALEFFQHLRARPDSWEKLPSTAECLDWLQAMLAIQGQAIGQKSLREVEDLGRQCLGTLGKTVADREEVARLFEDWLKS